MKDLFNVELEIGDIVVVTDYGRCGLYKGKITSFGKNRAYIEYKEHGHTYTTGKTSGYVCKVYKATD